MTRPLPRAILFALLALIVSAIISAIVLVILVGLPGSREAAAEFQQQAIARAVAVDMAVGAVVMLAAGWLAARPFAGRTAILTGLMTGLAFILADLAIVLLFGNAERLSMNVTGLSYLIKTAAATAGGYLAGRSGSRAGASPEPVSLDEK
jgi:hypothetical protein